MTVDKDKIIVRPENTPTVVGSWLTCKNLASATPPLFQGGMSATFLYFMPGQGHTRHNHPNAEQIIFIISGRAHQMVEVDGEVLEEDIGPGCLVHIPKGAFHSTFCISWEPVRIFTVYSPGGEEAQTQSNSELKVFEPGENPWKHRKFD